MTSQHNIAGVPAESSEMRDASQLPRRWTKEEVDRFVHASGGVWFNRMLNRDSFHEVHDERALSVIASAVALCGKSPSIVRHLEDALAAGDLDMDSLLQRIRDDGLAVPA